VADVRAFPTSRRVPHASGEQLGGWLPADGVGYLHLPELGGRRRALPDSPNTGWRTGGFRGYADHMASAEFARGIERLEAAARSGRTAVMCAEGLWWRCHRRLVADALVARGWTVRHILPDGGLAEHELTPFAVVEGERVTYPPGQGSLGY
jgi:uncharacterized protein (DUF488 family)